MVIRAAALAMDFFRSFDRRRHRPSQARVRSTTQRRGRPLKPPAMWERLTISTVQRPMAFKASRSFGPAWPPSAKIGRNMANRTATAFSTSGAPSRSRNPALCPTHPTSKPSVSVTIGALATLDPLAHVIAGNPAPFRGFHALAVEDTGGRPGLATLGQTRHPDKRAGHLVQSSVSAPALKIPPHRRNRWKGGWQQSPLATGCRNVKERIEHRAQGRSCAACRWTCATASKVQ